MELKLQGAEFSYDGDGGGYVWCFNTIDHNLIAIKENEIPKVIEYLQSIEAMKP